MRMPIDHGHRHGCVWLVHVVRRKPRGRNGCVLQLVRRLPLARHAAFAGWDGDIYKSNMSGEE